MSSSKKPAISFSNDGAYPCPVCHCGEISAMPLMDDALACNFCNHIFTASTKTQRLQMVSRQPPLTWRWNGKNWVGGHLVGVEMGWSYWVAGIILVALPPTLIGLAAYTFPPTPGSTLSWLPVAWVWLAFLFHLALVGWLVMEFYQFPVRAYLRVMQQHLFGRRHSLGR